MDKLSEKLQCRVPVQVERELYNQFKAYSAVTGVPVARVIREALEDFAATSLQVRLEALQAGRKRDNVVAIDEFSPNAFAVGATASS